MDTRNVLFYHFLVKKSTPHQFSVKVHGYNVILQRDIVGIGAG